MKSKTLFILFVLILFNSCTDSSYDQSRRAFAVIDITESIDAKKLNAELIISDIAKAIDIDKDYAGAALVKIITIDDISGSRIIEVKLEQDEKGNSLLRKQAIESFEKELNLEVSQLLDAKGDKNSSKVVSKIVSLLNSTIEGDDVFIYSDLLENSERTSFYNNDELNQASSSPESFFKKRFKELKINQLKGVTIHLFAIRSPDTDERINKALPFWKKLFEAHGAIVVLNQ
jgi:hypothetical protein